MTALVLEAFAKVNRYLHVLGKREDGYHELLTLFQTIDWSDRLSFEDGDELIVTHDAPAIPSGEDNLVSKAARALAAAYGVARGASIRLQKRIPAGAGLGGGSADAAATLLGLTSLWGLGASREELLPIAAALGADVPFFLYGGTARGTGRGDRIEALPDGPREVLVVVVPAFSLSTTEVYGALHAPALTPAAAVTKLSGSAPAGDRVRNDLEAAAESLRGDLVAIRRALAAAGAASARMSGSGSAVFGVFHDEKSAREGAARLAKLSENTRVEIVSTLSREEFARRAIPRPAA